MQRLFAVGPYDYEDQQLPYHMDIRLLQHYQETAKNARLVAILRLLRWIA